MSDSRAKSKFTLSQLRVLEAVARTGSFSAAAEELGVAQPSVSTQLRAVENQSRSRLLDRDGRNIAPTRFGNVVLPKVRALLSLAAELERIFEDERSLRSGVIRLGYSTHQFAMPVVSRFIDAYPNVKIEARSMASLDLIERLRRGLIDVAFVTSQQPPADLNSEMMRRDEIVLITRADHPLAQGGEPDGADATASWEAVSQHPLIRREETSMTRIVFDEHAAAAGAPMKTILDVGSWEAMRSGVLAGIGVGVALRGEIEPDPRFAAVRIRSDGLWAGHYACCMPEMRQIAAVDQLIRTAADTFPDARRDRESDGCVTSGSP